MNTIEKIKNSGLTGRGGAGFLTGLKWELVNSSKADKVYIICNASEGELGVFKDEYLLKKYGSEVINGIKIALDTFPNSEAYIYLRKDLYKSLGIKLKKIIGKNKIKLFREPGGYLCGEETTLIETMERHRAEPRLKPPYPPQSGLFGKPTLVNNVETFYFISKIIKGEYKKTRFVCISGDIKNKGVFEISEKWNIRKILKETNNYNESKFFVQIGGGACGSILSGKDLNKPMCGVGSIVVFDDKKTNTIALMKKWVDFYINENCGKCVPCREGIYRIKEMLKKPEKIDWVLFRDILEVMQQTSFCGLGATFPAGFLSLMDYRKINIK